LIYIYIYIDYLMIDVYDMFLKLLVSLGFRLCTAILCYNKILVLKISNSSHLEPFHKSAKKVRASKMFPIYRLGITPVLPSQY